MVGCQGYRDGVHRVGSTMGAIQIRDIRQAEEYQKVLPKHLGLSAKQVRVEPGSGVTQVTVMGIADIAEQQRISSELETLIQKNPQLNPLRVHFE
jgi:hypothetical protein